MQEHSTEISEKKILFMVLLGSVLEAYDYSLYGFFAPLLGELFFPPIDPASALLISFTVFAVGFIARPVGAAIFGMYGDRYGRKKILMASIMLMALPTAMIGLLPSYAQIGIAAGILLALCRLLQGFAVGAEFVGTMVYMVEKAPANRKTFYGSLCIVSGYLAMLLTMLILLALTNILSKETLHAWGWRIPFVLGLVLGAIGLYFRSRLTETPEFRQLEKKQLISFNPLMQVITTMPGTIFLGIGIVMLHVLGFYFLFVYMSSYLNLYYHIEQSTTSFINTLVILLAIITLPIVGIMAEKFDRKFFIFFSASAIVLFSVPLINLLQYGTFTAIFLAQGLLTILLCITSAVLPSLLASLFPANVRYTGMAICYNLSAVIFGGTAPLVLSLLITKTENIIAPGFYLMLAAAISLISTVLITRQRFQVQRVALKA